MKKRRDLPSLLTPKRSENRFLITKPIKSKIDWTISKKAERSDKKSKTKEIKLEEFRELNWMNSRNWELQINICMNSRKRPYLSELSLISIVN